MTLKPLKDLNTVFVWINKNTGFLVVIEFFAYTISQLNINLLSNTPNVAQTFKFVFNTYTNVYTPDILIATMLTAIILTLGGWYWSKSTKNIFFRTGIGIIVKGIPYYFFYKGFTYYVALFLLTGNSKVIYHFIPRWLLIMILVVNFTVVVWNFLQKHVSVTNY